MLWGQNNGNDSQTKPEAPLGQALANQVEECSNRDLSPSGGNYSAASCLLISHLRPYVAKRTNRPPEIGRHPSSLSEKQQARSLALSPSLHSLSLAQPAAQIDGRTPP